MAAFSDDRLIGIAIALTKEKKLDALLELILTEAMAICACDGGTVYIREGDSLRFHTTFTRSLDMGGVQRTRGARSVHAEPVPLSKEYVSASCALDKRLINIADVYASDLYDFSGTKRYDERNGYRTVSMMVVPMEDERGGVIGVLQLINAMDETGAIIPFARENERIVSAFAALAAVSLTNRRLEKDISDILHSFVRVMVDAIDTRSPYNANHTKSMVRYARRFIDWLDASDAAWKFPEERKDPFLMSVWLHDIGKLVVPLEIMDKSTRLGGLEKEIRSRVQIAMLKEEVRALKQPSRGQEAREQIAALTDAWALIGAANRAPVLSDSQVESLQRAALIACETMEGERIPLLSEEELDAITVRRGTLTDAERQRMEQHVAYTAQMLTKMQFHGDYESVPAWAAAHHEYLDGSGYPAKLRAEALSPEMRLLTIIDIYDALTAEDRPYKPPMAPEAAFAVLREMAENGKLDGGILALFEESRAWDKVRAGEESGSDAD